MNAPQMMSSAAKIWATAGLLVLACLFLPAPAQACCSCTAFCNTPYTLCCGSFCVNSSNDCVCGAQTPVCNIFGCNCNSQCGQWPCISTNEKCSFNSTCSSSAEEAKEAKERFDSIDGDHNGKISLDEALAWAQSLDKPWTKLVRGLPATLSAPDANEKDILLFLLDQVDSDKDGFIQPAELDSSLAPAAKTGS